MYAVLNIKSTTFNCFNRNLFFIRDLGRPNDSFLYCCAHSIFALKCLCFLYELLWIFHEVPGDVKFLYLKARKLSMSPGIIQYMLLQSGLSNYRHWNQNVQQDSEMAARIAALMIVNIKLNDPFYNWVMSYFSTLIVLRRLFLLLSFTLSMEKI